MAEKTHDDAAMIALVPRPEDAERIAVEGYQSAEDLHVTLAFLGEAEGLDEGARTAIEAGLRRLAAVTGPLDLKAWATSHFNPASDSACAVYLIGQEDDGAKGVLDDLAGAALALASREYEDLPEQHTPWIPHLTVGYGIDPDELTAVGESVIFDRLRLAVGPDNIDIPLTGGRAIAAAALAASIGRRLGRVETVLAARSPAGLIQRAAREFNELLHPRGKDGRFIVKNGFVSGTVDGPDGSQRKISRAKVRGFKDNPIDSADPIVEVELPDGSVARTTAGKVKTAAGPKARLGQQDAAPEAPEAPEAPDAPETPADSVEQARANLQRGVPQETLDFLSEQTVGLDTEDADTRASQLDGIMSTVFRSPLDTDQVHNRRGPAQDQWDPERVKLHEKIWTDIITKVEEARIPRDRDAFVLGGLPGAGKSSSLKPGRAASTLGVKAWDPAEEMPDQPTHVSINPDSIKEMLIDYGAMPSIPDTLKPMEAVTFIHEESSALSKIFLKRLSDEGYNVVLDNTMETAEGMLKRMKPLAADGYNFRGLFVDIPIEESKLSARERYKRNFKSTRGGRFVPSSVQHGRQSSRGRMSPNRDAFDDLAGVNENGTMTGKGWFTEFMIIDNSGISAGNPAGLVVLQGGGDGSPAKAIQEAVSAPVSAPV